MDNISILGNFGLNLDNNPIKENLNSSISKNINNYQQESGENLNKDKKKAEKPNDLYRRFGVFSDVDGDEKLTKKFRNDTLNKVIKLPYGDYQNEKLSKPMIDVYNKIINLLDDVFERSADFRNIMNVNLEKINQNKSLFIEMIIPRDASHERTILDVINNKRSGSNKGSANKIAPFSNRVGNFCIFPKDVFSENNSDHLNTSPKTISMDLKIGKAQRSYSKNAAVIIHELLHVATNRSDKEEIKTRADSLSEVISGNRRNIEYRATDRHDQNNQDTINNNRHTLVEGDIYYDKNSIVGEIVPFQNSIMRDYYQGAYNPRLIYSEKSFFKILPNMLPIPIKDEATILHLTNKLLDSDRATDGVVDYPYQNFDEQEMEQQRLDIDSDNRKIAFPTDYFRS